MTSEPTLEFRVARLENDRDAIYDLLTDIGSTQREHTQRLNAIDARLAGHDKRFDAMDQRFDSHDQRFDGIDERFDAIESTLAEIVRRLPEPA